MYSSQLPTQELISTQIGTESEVSTHRFSPKFTISILPPIASNLPCRLRHERRKRKPIVVFVFLEINIGDQEESVQQRRVFLRDDGVPDLIRGLRSVIGSVLGMHE
jgi:hypothetical protein